MNINNFNITNTFTNAVQKAQAINFGGTKALSEPVADEFIKTTDKTKNKDIKNLKNH